MAKSKFSFDITHSEETFTALAHMQYDLFCVSNQVARTAISIACILFGLYKSDSWWSLLLLFYGCYLITTRYLSANRTVRKLMAGIKESGMPMPSSRYEFTASGLSITPLPLDPDEKASVIPYSEIVRLGEDLKYFFLFPSEHGGYIVPKSLTGENTREFKNFLQQKTGLKFSRRTSPASRLSGYIKRRGNEPYHL